MSGHRGLTSAAAHGPSPVAQLDFPFPMRRRWPLVLGDKDTWADV